MINEGPEETEVRDHVVTQDDLIMQDDDARINDTSNATDNETGLARSSYELRSRKK